MRLSSQMHFPQCFESLTGYSPLPWQQALFEKFIQGEIPNSANLPTGLGKTSILAIWLCALALVPTKMPRRLVYVVNRRTVVDQTTAEAERLRVALMKPALADLRRELVALCALPLPESDCPLAISTLRGQFADNRQWCGDPSRPAVIVGTVDMIGSRLLFSGYGVGFKARPLHAGFLGQDALIIHDEAHLEPAFQRLIETIHHEQAHGRCKDFAPFHVMELTATTRGKDGEPESIVESRPARPFELTPDEQSPPEAIPEPTDGEPPIHIVWRRLKAPKLLTLIPVDQEKEVPAKIAKIAQSYKDQRTAVLVFVRTVEAVTAIQRELEKSKRSVVLLTGTIRGKERDELVEQSDFKRFLKGATTGETVYLVCTSAGEVGIDISADHMVCDLSTFEGMAQRFGRANRYGLRKDTCITVVHPTEFDPKDKLRSAREATLKLLGHLNRDASPKALGDLRKRNDLPCRIEEAFSPEPVIPPATDIIFDAWALTSIRQPMPGRPPAEPYLHGIADWQPPETRVAWRIEVEIITGNLLDLTSPADLLDDYPLLPHEVLRDRSDRVFKQLERLAQRHPGKPVWLIDERGPTPPTTLGDLVDKQRKVQIEGKTILLPPSAGGLSASGMLDGDSDRADDVADAAFDEHERSRRQRIWDNELVPDHLRAIRTIDIQPDADETDNEQVETTRRFWHWCDSPREGGRTANKAITWERHVGDVVDYAERIVARLSLLKEIAEAIVLAAKFHDHGKKREQFQTTLGNLEYPRVVLAKSRQRAATRLPESFRHEFASMLDVQADAEFGKLSPEMQNLALHLIAAHHGRARPHFEPDEAFDPERPLSDAETLISQTPRRFASLQHRFGRWGLAYLESILRAADWAASAAEAEKAS